MKKTYSLILVAAACAVLLVSIAVVTPKAVRAAVATLIRDQDNAARHPFTFFAECTGSINCNEFDGSTPGKNTLSRTSRLMESEPALLMCVSRAHAKPGVREARSCSHWFRVWPCSPLTCS
jgi:hypothetical protein